MCGNGWGAVEQLQVFVEFVEQGGAQIDDHGRAKNLTFYWCGPHGDGEERMERTNDVNSSSRLRM